MKHTTELRFHIAAIVLGVVILMLTLFDGMLLPELRSCSWIQDTTSGLPTAIELHYNQPMAKRITELGVQIQPPLEGGFSWKGNVLVFTPSTGVRPDTQYTVTQTSLQSLDGKGNSNPEVCTLQTPSETIMMISGSPETYGQIITYTPSTAVQQPLTPSGIVVTQYQFQRSSGDLWYLGVDMNTAVQGQPLVEQQQLYRTNIRTAHTTTFPKDSADMYFQLSVAPVGNTAYVYKATFDQQQAYSWSGLVAIDGSKGTETPFWYEGFANSPIDFTPGGDGIIGQEYLSGNLVLVPINEDPESVQSLGTVQHYAEYSAHLKQALVWGNTETGGAQISVWLPGMMPTTSHSIPEQLLDLTATDEEEHLLLSILDNNNQGQLRSLHRDRGTEVLWQSTDQTAMTDLMAHPSRSILYATLTPLPLPQTPNEVFLARQEFMQIIRIDRETGELYTIPIPGKQPTWW